MYRVRLIFLFIIPILPCILSNPLRVLSDEQAHIVDACLKDPGRRPPHPTIDPCGMITVHEDPEIRQYANYKSTICYFIFDHDYKGFAPFFDNKTKTSQSNTYPGFVSLEKHDFANHSFNIDNARNACRKFGGSTLPTIRDEEEFEFLINFAYSCGVCNNCHRKYEFVPSLTVNQKAAMDDYIPLGLVTRDLFPTEILYWDDGMVSSYKPPDWIVSQVPTPTAHKTYVYIDLTDNNKWVSVLRNHTFDCTRSKNPRPCRTPVFCKYDAVHHGKMKAEDADGRKATRADVMKDAKG